MAVVQRDENDATEERYPDEQKVFVSRIPVKFTSEHLQRLIEEQFPDSVLRVDLAYEKKEEEEEKEVTQHQGFGFVVMKTIDSASKVIALQTLKGKRTGSSKKTHTLYVGPVLHEEEDSNGNKPTKMEKICFLWKQSRCPYGENCRFEHTGEGGCLVAGGKEKDVKRKCWNYLKGKCDDTNCPFLHTGEVKQVEARSDKEKACINWKTKGKCRKGSACPYLHDPEVQARALAKRRRNNEENRKKKNGDKASQPLSVRVFGLNYETTSVAVRTFFKDCGKIVSIDFPVWPDSGRSKGYCQVLFQSPKAVAVACAMDKSELDGRWLQIQAGKMFLEQWESKTKVEEESPAAPETGEFGQKKKKRKSHGY